MKVLVVDDEPVVRQMVCATLELNGHETLEAQHGEEALELAARYQCDLVITDWLMPGITGPQLVAQLKECHYPANYLLISAYRSEEIGSGLPLLSKPFSPTRLMDVIQRLRQESPLSSDLERERLEEKVQWSKSFEEQEEILSEATCTPGTDGALLVEKAGLKRKAAYIKHMDALHKYQHSLREPAQLESAEPEDSNPER